MLIIDAAIRAGVQRFIPAEFGSNTEDPAVVERLPMFKSKLAVLDHLKMVSATNTNFSYTAICNGAFFDWVNTSISTILLTPDLSPQLLSLCLPTT